MQIIPYSDEYKSQISRLISDILKNEFNMTINLADLENIYETYQKDNGNFWIVIEEGRVIGTAALRNYGDNRGMLKRMFIDKSFRGKQIGRKLLNVVFDFAKSGHYKEIYLTTIPELFEACKFYERLGFSKIAVLPPGIPDYGDHIFYKINIDDNN